MSIITNEMVEKAIKARETVIEGYDPKYDYIGFVETHAALEAVANDIIEACAKEAENAGYYDHGSEEAMGLHDAADRIRALKTLLT